MTQHEDRLAYRLQRHRLPFLVAGRLVEAQLFVQRTLRPFIDLAVRVWLAQLFWVASMSTMFEGQTASALRSSVTPIEAAASLLLLFGLSTRFAAIALLVVAQTARPDPGIIIVLDGLLGWYVIFGAGSLSIDHALRRGLRRAPLLLVTATTRIFQELTRIVGPPYVLALRLLVAAVLIGPPLYIAFKSDDLTTMSVDPALLLAADLPLFAAIPLAFLVTVGLGARFSAVALLLLLLGTHSMIGPLPATSYWAALLGLLVSAGAGRWSLDAIALRKWRELRDTLFTTAQEAKDVPHVVIVGAGFAGLGAAHSLRNSRCRITLIDRHNYHLFQPLLYQVATATLSPANIATPIRMLMRDQPNTKVLLGRVTGVDPQASVVLIGGDQRITYDYLILATGARHAYFGREDDWQDYAPGLKKIEDATNIRRRLLIAFERAENASDRSEQQRQLTFVVVGGGPTGVELAGSIAELARHGMVREFRNINPALARVVLIQSGERVLPTLHPSLSAKAKDALQDLGVEVRTGSRVEHVDEDGVIVAGERLECRTVLWAAGVVASPAARWIGAEADKAGRLKVCEDLSVPNYPNVFAAGDTALITSPDGGHVPGLASAAKQAGRYTGAVIAARVKGSAAPSPFRCRHFGSLATIGRKAAVADFGWLRLSGALAWWLWGVAHIFFLLGSRNRISVALEWIWAYLTFRRSTRLITGDEGAP